jgi:hypothetical protein
VGMTKRQTVMAGLAVLLLVSAIAVGLSVGLTRPSPLPPPTTNSTTTTPFVVSDALLQTFRGSIPGAFLEAIQNASSPQGRAYEWLRKHPAIDAANDEHAVRRLTHRFALASFYYSTGGGDEDTDVAVGGDAPGPAAAGWSNNSGWLEYDVSECDWFGCACSTTDGPIMFLHLTGNNLAGTLSSPAFELVLVRGSLAELALDNNFLTGPLPTEFGLLSSLLAAILNDNRFSGSIPVELGNMTALLGLAMDRVQSLTGPTPTALGRLSNLFALDLARNRLTGTLPSEIGQLSNLEGLGLHQNPRLNGTIPASWGAAHGPPDDLAHGKPAEGHAAERVGLAIEPHRP